MKAVELKKNNLVKAEGEVEESGRKKVKEKVEVEVIGEEVGEAEAAKN